MQVPTECHSKFYVMQYLNSIFSAFIFLGYMMTIMVVVVI